VIGLVLLFACATPTGPAAADSRSAVLAQRAGEVGRRADLLAAHTRDLEGLFDELRAAPPEGREAVRVRILARSHELRDEAHTLRDEVTAIEEAARVY
jgi:hypothetical protein